MNTQTGAEQGQGEICRWDVISGGDLGDFNPVQGLEATKDAGSREIVFPTGGFHLQLDLT